MVWSGMGRGAAGIALVTLLLVGARVGAQPPQEGQEASAGPPPPGQGASGRASPEEDESGADPEDPRALFREGREAYVQGDFQTAYDRFEAAYRRTEELRLRVLLLFNMAQALDRMDRTEEALRRYEQYLALMPDGPQAGVVRGRVEVLRRRLAQERERDPLRTEPPEPEARGGAAWVPWAVAGGVLLAGGVVAAVLLAGGEDEVAPLPDHLGQVDLRAEALR